MRHLTLAALLALLAAPASADEPAYPYPLPGWYATRLKAMRKPLTLRYTHRSMAGALGDICDQVGARGRLDIAGKPPTPVNLHVDRLGADQTLKLICDLKALSVCHTREGIVVTDTPAKYPPPEHAALRRRIDVRLRALRVARKARENDEGGIRKKARLALALERETELDFTETPAIDIVQFLSVAGTVRIVVDQSARTVGLPASVTIRGKMPLATALKRTVGPKLGWVLKQGVVMVTSLDNVARARRAAERAARTEARIARRLAGRLEGSPQGLTVARLHGWLAARDIDVVTGPGAWRVRERLTLCQPGMTLGQLRDRLARIGVEMVVEPERVWILRP